MFAAAAGFAEHRLPETITGLPRDAAHPFPSIYPKSCSAQAWSAIAVTAIVQALLPLRPAAPACTVLVGPAPAPVAARVDRHRTEGRRDDRDAPRQASPRQDHEDPRHRRDRPLTVVHQPPRHAVPRPAARAAALARTSFHCGNRRPTHAGGTDQ